MDFVALNRLVDDVVALNATRAPNCLPPGVRLLLDVVRAGKCGEHAPDEGLARVAQATGEWNEDRASSDAFLDLAWALRNLSPDGSSNELCAAALAEAWRAEYPFRRGRDGDPLEVLVPQLDDARAARALDRARVLPRPPVAVARLGRDVEKYFAAETMDAPKVPFDRQLALAMLAVAEHEILTLDSRATQRAPFHVKGALDDVLTARAWVENPALRYMTSAALNDHAHYVAALSLLDSVKGTSESKEAERARLRHMRDVFLRAQRAVRYVKRYNDLVPDLQRAETDVDTFGTEKDAARLTQLRAFFPDRYPEAS